FHQKPASPMILKTRRCPKYIHGVSVTGTVVESHLESGRYILLVRLADGSVVTVFAGGKKSKISYKGGSVEIGTVPPGDAVHMHLISDPTQAGYFQLVRGEDLDLRNVKNVKGSIASLDPYEHQIVLGRFRKPYIIVSTTKQTRLYTKNGKRATFSQLTVGAPLSVDGLLDTKSSVMRTTIAVRMLKNA
ncbi:MAG TPA: hypothetical protein VFB34_05925, partial [Chloroflexota bacterium]|nr:hypothetical protein [Chloroflexota bacterium]